MNYTMKDVTKDATVRIYRQIRTDGTLYGAGLCLALARYRVACIYGEPVVDDVDEWSGWEPVPGAEALARRVMVVDDWTYVDDQDLPSYEEAYADLRQAGLARHVAAAAARARLDLWEHNAAEARWAGVRVEVSYMGRTADSSLWGIAAESLSDPYLRETIEDCTADAVHQLSTAAAA